jgi:hypothetical protein
MTVSKSGVRSAVLEGDMLLSVTDWHCYKCMVMNELFNFCYK